MGEQGGNSPVPAAGSRGTAHDTHGRNALTGRRPCMRCCGLTSLVLAVLVAMMLPSVLLWLNASLLAAGPQGTAHPLTWLGLTSLVLLVLVTMMLPSVQLRHSTRQSANAPLPAAGLQGTAHHDAKRSTALDVLVFVWGGALQKAQQEARALNESCASKGRSFHLGGGDEGDLTDLLALLSPRVVVLLATGHAQLKRQTVVDVVAQRDDSTRPRLVIASSRDSAQLCEGLARAGVHAMGWSTRYEAAAAMSFSVGVVEALLAAEGDMYKEAIMM